MKESHVSIPNSGKFEERQGEAPNSHTGRFVEEWRHMKRVYLMVLYIQRRCCSGKAHCDEEQPKDNSRSKDEEETK